MGTNQTELDASDIKPDSPIQAEEEHPTYFKLLDAFAYIRDILQPHLHATHIESMLRNLYAMSDEELDEQIEIGRNNVPDELARWVREKKIPQKYREQCVDFYLKVQQLDQSAISTLSQRRWEEFSYWVTHNVE